MVDEETYRSESKILVETVEILAAEDGAPREAVEAFLTEVKTRGWFDQVAIDVGGVKHYPHSVIPFIVSAFRLLALGASYELVEAATNYKGAVVIGNMAGDVALAFESLVDSVTPDEGDDDEKEAGDGTQA